MDEDQSKSVLGTYWAVSILVAGQYLKLESCDPCQHAAVQVIPLAGTATGEILVLRLLLLTGQHVWGFSVWKRVSDSFNDSVNHKQIWT